MIFIAAFSGARSRTHVLYMTQKFTLSENRLLQPPKNNAALQTPYAMHILITS